jgi:DNA-binding FadR family transcriptional regulator
MSTVSVTPLTHAVLRPVHGATRSGTIVSRVSDAIVLGVFVAGQQIPSEAELAGVFGVAQMTVRDALTTLRGDNLIVTRRGRGGGSFVTDDAAARLLTGTLSDDDGNAAALQEARDAATHLTTLVGGAAELAATRVSSADRRTLAAAVDAFDNAADPLETAQATARIAMLLGSWSQSPRLTREIIAAEISWIPWAAHAYSTDLPDGADGTDGHPLDDLVTAVRAGDGDAARHATAQHIAAVVHALDAERLAALSTARHGTSPTEVIATVDARFAAVVHALDTVAASDTPLPVSCAACLGAHPDISGVGFAHHPDLGRDQVDWFIRDPAGMHRQDVDATPGALGFSGYRSLDWFALPETTGHPVVVGPYVDFLCGDSYTFTLAVPSVTDGTFDGVYVADIAVHTLERAVRPLLATCPGTPVLVNATGRVAASADPLLPVGSLAGDGLTTVAASTRFPFRVLTRRTAATSGTMGQ